MKKKFEKLDQPLQRLLDNLKYNDVYFFSVLEKDWEKIAGLPISKYIKPVKFDKYKSVLYLKSYDTTWEKEILKNKSEFIILIKKSVKGIDLKNVIFVKGV